MIRSWKVFIFWCAVIPLLVPHPIWAGTILIDPDIPNGETVTYLARIGDESFTIEEEVTVKKEGETYFYEIRSSSKLQEKRIRILKPTLALQSIHTLRKYPQATLQSTMTVLDEKPSSTSDEIKLTNFEALTYILRGYPFGKLEKLKIGYYGEQKENPYSMSVKFKGRRTKMIQGSEFDCYKLEFNMEGFWGNFLPSMELWYSVAPPHYLVYLEGPYGPPGTPKRVMELVK